MTLEVFQTLFTVFLVLTIVFLILSIVFFFVFDIRKIFSIKTGRAVRKSVKELNEINRSEDNRRRKKYKGHSMQLSKELTGDFERVTGEITGTTRNTGNITDDSVVTEQLDNNETVILKQESVVANETEVLISPNTVTSETEVLIVPRDEIEDNPNLSVITEESLAVTGLFNIIEKKEVMFAEETI